MIPFAILSALLLGGAGDPPAGPPAPKCVSDGRYWIHKHQGQKIFCFDGEGYNEEDAPPGIKSYFQPTPAPGTAEGGDPTFKTVPTAGVKSTAFSGSPSLPSGGSGGGGGGGSRTFSAAGSGGGGGGGAGGGGKAAIRDLDNMSSRQAAPPKERVSLVRTEAVLQVGIGMGRSEVTERLGSPQGRIMNSGDDGVFEIWTYLTQGGGSATVRIRDGKVVSIRKPE